MTHPDRYGSVYTVPLMRTLCSIVVRAVMADGFASTPVTDGVYVTVVSVPSTACNVNVIVLPDVVTFFTKAPVRYSTDRPPAK